MATDNWIGKATARMKEKGTVGSFGRAAKKAGESTGTFAKQVLKSGSKASPAMKKKAQFAKNVAGVGKGADLAAEASREMKMTPKAKKAREAKELKTMGSAGRKAHEVAEKKAMAKKGKKYPG